MWGRMCPEGELLFSSSVQGMFPQSVKPMGGGGVRG